jgi:hypothetical protein
MGGPLVAAVRRTAADTNDEEKDDDRQQPDRDLRIQPITLTSPGD